MTKPWHRGRHQGLDSRLCSATWRITECRELHKLPMPYSARLAAATYRCTELSLTD
jgi:hypothetical protein